MAEEDAPPAAVEAVSWIEAALQAGLGRDGRARPEAAREALREVAPQSGGEPLEAWLESVAIALDGGAGESAGSVAARIRADRGRSLGAHSRIEGAAVGDLVRRS